MKKSFPLLVSLSLFFALVMLFFTFFNWGWFSDKGMVTGFEIPLSDRENPLQTLADLAWISAPITLLLSLVLSLLFPEKEFSMVLRVLATFPLFLFSIFKFLLFTEEDKFHFSVAITLLFLIGIALLSVAASLSQFIEPFALQFPFIHIAVELGLILLSFALENKCSQFYFSQSLLVGLRYRFFLFSICFYYLSYSLSLAFRLLAERARK